MKVLIFTSVFPYPLDEGGKVAQYSFIQRLVKENDVLLICENGINHERHAANLQESLPLIKIRLLNVTINTKSKTLTGLIVKFIEKILWRLKKKLPAEIKQLYLNPVFLNPVRLQKPEIIEQLLRIIKQEKPDLIQVDFIDNADLGLALPGNIPKVLVLHDLRFSCVAQSAKISGLSEEYSNYVTRYVQTHELAFMQNFDRVITFSDDDNNILRLAYPTLNVTTIPFAVLDDNIRTPPNGKNAVKKLIFIGPEHHAANYDAIKWYANEIEPLIWHKHRMVLNVIGNWSQNTIDEFTREGIEFSGFVDNLQTAFSSAVMIVPLRIGSGIRTKILDAFAFGVPVISTTLGCEGLGVEDGKQILFADTAREFETALLTLLQDKDLVDKLTKNAQDLIKSRFSQSGVYFKRFKLYSKVVDSYSKVLVPGVHDQVKLQ